METPAPPFGEGVGLESRWPKGRCASTDAGAEREGIGATDSTALQARAPVLDRQSVKGMVTVPRQQFICQVRHNDYTKSLLIIPDIFRLCCA